ncbi:MAG: haloalkane dehalogenase [Kibdelosporangium sp.]
MHRVHPAESKRWWRLHISCYVGDTNVGLTNDFLGEMMASVDVLDSVMHYEQSGVGAPIVFLHGNPTSSYLWRRVLPAVGGPGRLLAPDLIGMGQSGKPDIGYTFDDHSRYLAAWFDALGLTDVVLVGHDWGGALAFDWASRNPDRVRGIAFLETIVRPLTWADLPDGSKARYDVLRAPGVGEQRVLEENIFIERNIRATILGELSDDDLAVYRKPYPTPESRRPLLQWPRSMPIEGSPAEVVSRMDDYVAWLAKSIDVPKLLLTFEAGERPTLLIDARLAKWCAENIASLEVEGCGPASHLAPEDQPEAIGSAIARWLQRQRLR